MLVLTRFANQSIIIDEALEVQVLEVKRNRAKLRATLREEGEWAGREIAAGEYRLNDGMRFGTVSVTVVDIRNGKVRLGVETPADVMAYRKEVWEALRSGPRVGGWFEDPEPGAPVSE